MPFSSIIAKVWKQTVLAREPHFHCSDCTAHYRKYIHSKYLHSTVWEIFTLNICIAHYGNYSYFHLNWPQHKIFVLSSQRGSIHFYSFEWKNAQYYFYICIQDGKHNIHCIAQYGSIQIKWFWIAQYRKVFTSKHSYCTVWEVYTFNVFTLHTMGSIHF